jgi:hypothetical protein
VLYLNGLLLGFQNLCSVTFLEKILELIWQVGYIKTGNTTIVNNVIFLAQIFHKDSASVHSTQLKIIKNSNYIQNTDYIC